MTIGDLPDNRYSLRFLETGMATVNFVDRQWDFVHPDSSKEHTVWSMGIRVAATVAPLEISFDGVNVHGRIAAGTEKVYWDRYEAGIAVRGALSVFVIEAW